MPIIDGRPQIKKVSVKHDAIMDFMIANPATPLRDVAANFQISQSWLSSLIYSDAFQIQLKSKQVEVFEETVIPLRAKVVGVAHAAVEKLGEKIDKSEDPAFILETTDKVLHRLGWAPQRLTKDGPSQTNIQQNFYVADKETLSRAREKMARVQEQKGRLIEQTSDSPSEEL